MSRTLNSLFPVSIAQKLRNVSCIFYLMVGFLCAAAPVYGKIDSNSTESVEPIAAANLLATYDWNLRQPQLPLLTLPDHLGAAFDLSSTRSVDSSNFSLFEVLEFNDRANGYILRLSDRTDLRGRTVEFSADGTPGRYSSADNSFSYLVENRGVITIHARENTEYTFIRFNDGATKCIRIKPAVGPIITIVYAQDNLIHSLVDAAGRTINFNYEDRRITSITQTWTASSAQVTRTWPVASGGQQIKLAHAAHSLIGPAGPGPADANLARPLKAMPNNAVSRLYTTSMIDSDKQLAAIFGGPGAVAAANGFEPDELGAQYPLYRGDVVAFDGRLLRGHLSYAMHLYGNRQGTGESDLFVPAGFTSHSSEPGPTDAAVTFFYPRLGNLTNVTLAVFHVAHFAIERGPSISTQSGRVRIGSIGGPGGSCAIYKHSHIEFYRGDVGLPSASAREHLRIDPAAVFGSGSVGSTNQATSLR